MEKKQSSIEWVEQQFQTIIEKGNVEIENLIWQQAKAMHKKEIEDAYRISPNNELWSNSGIDYYNETFGGEE